MTFPTTSTSPRRRLAGLLARLMAASTLAGYAWLGLAGQTTRASGRRADGSTFPIEISLASYDDEGATSA